jgi:hypothetical protein
MTTDINKKQQAIRLGISNIAHDWFMPDGLASQTMPNDRSFEGDVVKFLDSQDVVFLVDGELPPFEVSLCGTKAIKYWGKHKDDVHLIASIYGANIRQAGYSQYHRLVESKD